MFLALFYLIIFFLCWIISAMIIRRACEADENLLEARIKLLEIVVHEYIHKKKYNLISAETADMHVMIRDELKLYENEIKDDMENTIRVEVETKFEGFIIIRPYLNLRRICHKKINKDCWN